MAPVQTFSSSPITAAKAPTATATAQPQQSPTAEATSTTSTTTSAAAPSASASRYGPPSAQPGSRPPAPTNASSSSASPPAAAVTGVQATPTQPLASSDGPAPPQPGAVPTPPGAAAASASSTLPPPPKKGETLGPEHTGGGIASPDGGGYPAPTTMPAQMSYAPPQTSHAIRGTSTTTSAFASPYEPGPVQLPVAGTGLGGGVNLATDMSHPPGYQQDVHAAEFSSGQRAAHNAYVAQNSDFGSGFTGGGGGGAGDGQDSVWNTAKKWASAAGDKLAEAEGEVWKAVNKDQK